METSRSIEEGVLEDSLQEITVTENGGITGIFIFSSDFPAFEGHFPGQPILPAVVQLASVRLLAEKNLGVQLVPISIERAKFKSMIGPDDPVTISITLAQDEENVVLSYSITTGKGKASTGEITCRSVSR